MFARKISKIVKRDGSVVNFDRNKIVAAIAKSALSVSEDPKIGNKLVDKIEKKAFKKYKGRLPTVENIQDIIEETLINEDYQKIAKSYILYREKRQELRESKKLYGVSKDELKLSINAIKVLQSRYLLRDEDGEIIENPIDMFRRVAKAVASVGSKYNEDVKKSEQEFFEIMSRLEFLPNSPSLMNAGTRFQQLSACFVLTPKDSLSNIFDTLKIAALIQKTGGGTGFSFSELRPRGSIVGSTKGIASGPVSFMSVFDKMTDVIKQGSKRRGANMGVLRVDHPDILEFITCKNDQKAFTNFNISVSLTDKFMEAVMKNKEYGLIDLRTKKTIKRINARSIFDLIVTNAWAVGDPGLIFIDRINKLNPLNEEITATNTCGEQPLLPFESCVLGSVNLTKYVKNQDVDWNKLKKAVNIGVRFLDNVIDTNDYVIKEIEDITKFNRRIGLGVMGFADMLIMLNIPYNSNKALKLADKLMKFINHEARKVSEELGRQRGDFPKFKESRLYGKYKHARNVAVTTIAPTGSISIIANSCSSGIEPLFAVSYVREILEGTKLVTTNSIFKEIARKRGFYSQELIHEISKVGSIQHLKQVPDDVKKLFVTAMDIDPEWHVKMQAVFQKHVENGVSKTINMPESASREDVKKAYLLAYKLGCKGITIFRYGSKGGKQVLYIGEGYEKRIKAQSEFSGGCPGVECGN
ncbi:adenosylcobalamin-dependent ribonucleoside-diphosphate reductase [Candidatus Woesearchaeota archaeon]|nr:adenosylcobalamin-dependent ribonucleoside-diphosphate reductase [Candidatus Woesearchaeota archaeon]